MEKDSDIQATCDAGACAEAVELMKSGISYEDLYCWRPDFRAWRWAHLETLTSRQAQALEKVAPLEFWIRALGNLDIWKSANLESANLVRANLESANLVRANLVRANLYSANLYSANLVRANLVRANLESANLVRANLYSANLYSANLESAYLESANLESANLVRAYRPENDIKGWIVDDYGRLRRK